MPGELLSATVIASEFALCGALHALALVSSLTARLSLGRELAFVVAAALMSVAAAWLALLLLRRVSNLSGPLPILIGAAAVGAWAYAHTIRLVLRLRVGSSAAVRISMCCAVAVAAAYPSAKRIPSAAWLALAIPWWLAFSAAFAVQDVRRKG